MSSALAAFAKTQAAARAEPTPSEVVEEDDAGYTSADDHAKSDAPAPSSALAGFAQSQQQAKSNAVSLVDVANEQRTAAKPTTLVDVARKLDNQSDQATGAQLRAIAADVQAEERDAAQRRAQQIDRELATASQQVKQEQQAARHAEVARALRDAANQEPADDAADDQFEADDATVQRVAARVVETTAPTAAAGEAAKRAKWTTLSVDRHLLKQRQQRHGLDSKSTGKAKTLKDKLSAFQFDQLSLTQQRVFLAMLADDPKASGGSIKKRCNMHAIEALATDRATQLRQKQKLLKQRPPQFAKLDDVRHCRFKPKIKAVDGGGRDRDDDDDDDGGGNQRREDFIRRMEATERVRTEQLRRTRAERDYLAQIDKKECPQCGNPQSYAELTQKRKKCPNCGVTYKSRLAWGEVADEFLARMASHVRATQQSTAQDNQAPEHGDGKANKLLWRDVRDEFLGRVQLDRMQRELSKERILQELEAQCSFAPQISARARRLQLGDFDERLRRDLENRRVRQEQYRLLSAAIARAEAGTGAPGPSKAGRNHLPPGPRPKAAALPRSFEARLQKDLEQRRARLAAHDTPKGSSGRSRGLY